MRRHPILVSAAVAALVPGCGEGPAPAGTGEPATVVRALCDAETAARTGDAVGAAAAFEDVHAALHRVAANLQERDAALAAGVLEAKQGIEAAIAAGADAETLAARLGGLSAALQASLATAGMPAEACG